MNIQKWRRAEMATEKLAPVIAVRAKTFAQKNRGLVGFWNEYQLPVHEIDLYPGKDPVQCGVKLHGKYVYLWRLGAKQRDPEEEVNDEGA